MTGYGEAAAEAERFLLSAEIKSVNNRFLKIASKIPEEISWVQNELEDRVRKRLLRGSVFFTVRFEPRQTADLYEIDRSVLEKYLDSLRSLSQELSPSESIEIKDVLLLPGVVNSEEALRLGKQEVLPVAIDVMDRAIEDLLSMRRLEGQNLEVDLRARCVRMRDLLQDVRKAAPRAIEEYQQKLDQRVRQLLGDQQAVLGPEDILKEVAILAERSDISEEIARMDSHLQQFSDALDSQQPVGRRLEFILQEMFRESNTMGAKATSAELALSVVELKSEVDRVKEQVLNIE
ncbi:MAG: YicC family protein [Planctomycetes bacterium]|nr:YicC family protein [Planctomycetota bacterium]